MVKLTTIKITNLTFGFDEQLDLLFDNLSINLDSTWKLGLVGRNGAGKTTLLKLFQGLYDYQGTIESSLTFNYFPMTVKSPQAYAIDAISEVIDVKQWQLERECQLLGLDPVLLWRPFNQLSGGEQTKLLLAVLFTGDGTFSLIDEPTNHLEQRSRKLITNYLKKKTGYIIVSHDTQVLNDLTNHILAIEKNQLGLYQGSYQEYVHQKQLSDDLYLKQNQKLNKEINRLEKTVQEKKIWGQDSNQEKGGRNQAKHIMKRAEAINTRREKQLNEKRVLINNLEIITDLDLNYQPTHRKKIVECQHFSLGYTEEEFLFKPISFTLYQGDQLMLYGDNGVGKTTLLDYLGNPQKFEGQLVSTGHLFREKELTISQISQDFLRNHGKIADFCHLYQLDLTNFLTNLRKIGLERTVFDTAIEKMSMGQRKKIEVIKSLLIPAEFYIWDEPLNYLDIFNQEQLEKVLVKTKPTLIFTEHDAKFSGISSNEVYLERY